MCSKEELRDYVPESSSYLLNKSSKELRSKIPELARDEDRMEEIDKSIQRIPTDHDLHLGDSREVLKNLDDESIDLVITSPPYFNLKDYETPEDGQLGEIDEYTEFISMLDDIWKECHRVLRPGGRLCVVVGDVLRSRSEHGRHRVVPLHATIQEHATDLGFDNLAPVIWHKIGNASLEAGGNARFLGKPYEPGAVIKNDIEYILLFRKQDGYRSPSTEERILSTIEADTHQQMFRQIWEDIKGESQTNHPAPYPADLAERLIRMFSFVGDTILDPFAGTGSTAVAASRCGRDSSSIEIEPEYRDIAETRLENEREDLQKYEKININLVDN